MIRQANHVFGPAGLLEQDDGENWSQSTRSARGVASRKLGQHIPMGLGRDQAVAAPRAAAFIEGVDRTSTASAGSTAHGPSGWRPATGRS